MSTYHVEHSHFTAARRDAAEHGHALAGRWRSIEGGWRFLGILGVPMFVMSMVIVVACVYDQLWLALVALGAIMVLSVSILTGLTKLMDETTGEIPSLER